MAFDSTYKELKRSWGEYVLQVTKNFWLYL